MSEIKVNSIKGVGASQAAITIDNSSGACTANLSSVNGGSIGTNNLVINGNMLISQRGIQFTAQSGTAYHLDRWEINAYNVDTGRYQVDQVTDAPDGFKKSLKYSCTTANGSQNTNEQMYFQQQIEAQNIDWLKFYHASPDKVTLSFHVKANNTGSYGAALKLGDNNSTENSGDTRSYPFQFTISSANTWEKKTVSITLDSDTNQAKSTGANFGMAVQFWLSAGTARDSITSLNAWTSNNNQTSAVDNKTFFSSTNNNFFITGVQLEVGSTASNFASESYADTLRKCQRYLYILDLGAVGNIRYLILHRLNNNSGAPHQPIEFPVVMRSAPSMSKDGTSYTGTGYQSNISLGGVLASGCNLYGDTATAAGDSTFHRVNPTSGSTLRYFFSAEL